MKLSQSVVQFLRSRVEISWWNYKDRRRKDRLRLCKFMLAL
jgi:hypothetical protein